MFSGGRERVHWEQMGYEKLSEKTANNELM